MIRLLQWVLITLLPLAFAMAFAAPEAGKLRMPASDTQSLMIENNDLSGKTFFAAYTGKDLTERRYAEMYLLGVLDATEQGTWCDYKTLKTITLDEAVYTGMKKMTPSQLEQRASTLIKEILAKQFRCRNKR